MIDTLHIVSTPEGVDLDLRAAGPVARAFAYGIDMGLFLLLLFAGALALAPLGEVGMGAYMLLIFGLYWFYPVVFEVYSDGQTPGKRLMGLRVVERDGTPVSARASLLRNLVRVVDFLPTFWLAGLLSMLLDSSFRRLGDLAAGTLVVYASPFTTGDRARSDRDDVAPIRPPLALEPEEERAIIAFSERVALLTQERANELAGLAVPLIDDGDPRRRIESMAAWLTGRHG